MKKKIRYSELATPQPPALTKFTPVSSPAVPPSVAPKRTKAPGDLAGALVKARAAEARQAAETLSHVEARAAAAHARELAAAEARAAEQRELAAESEPSEPSPVVDMPPDTSSSARERSHDADHTDPSWDDEDHIPTGPRRPLRERARSRSGIAELLMFRIASERFAVELMSVEEAIDLPEVHHVPEMPPAMLGVITVRGALTPVYTPDGALGVPVQGKGAALIFRSERGRFALAIDDVDDVMTLDLANLRDAPGIEGADSVVLGVSRNESVIVALVDAEALIMSCQAIPALELA